ncbi:DUF1848 domain-containing protein [Desulfatitalea tepidiphila]|uniref:DUF1848 domain-containing protein n=1 Tax=Desulfatitalea tepidiphila TaxID=1185843 RepID=UPI0006B3FE00|nr:DUF1848 domain-containing protein [Desulfatitalea tepidiphila]
MAFKGWDRIQITSDNGQTVSAIAPVIISASRATDLPAFHWKWFFHRLNIGHAAWVNPFNKTKQYVSFSKARVFVFWTKNPSIFMKDLDELNKRNINYYFQFTLNDYETEGLEPGIPPLQKRIDTFKSLSDTIGKERVIWRFDPLILVGGITHDALLDKVHRIGLELKGYTEKLVFSFADIGNYKKVIASLNKAKLQHREFTEDLMVQMGSGIGKIAKELSLDACTCGEGLDLSPYGISHNKCIDDDLMIRLFSHDDQLMNFLNPTTQLTGIMDSIPGPTASNAPKDPGQRKECGCIVSKDIGQYDTCGHFCQYCYANKNKNIVRKNLTFARGHMGETIVPL